MPPFMGAVATKIVACRPRIAIDFSSWDGLTLAQGLYRYGIDLIYGLAVTRPSGEFHLIGSRETPPPELTSVFTEPGSRWHYHQLRRRPPTRGAYFLDQFPAVALANRIRPDLYHGLDYFLPFAAPCRLVATIYDLMTEVLTPRRLYRRPLYLNCFRSLVRSRISRLIAISETTAYDLRTRWSVPVNRLSTVLCGTRLPALRVEGNRESLLGPPILLARYSVSKQKNFEVFLEAFANLQDEFPKLRLILFGRGGVSDEQDAAVTRRLVALGIADAVTRTGVVSDTELDQLYRHATLFVLPSLYEGFGLTLLEAMARGVCVVAHRDGAMAEVVGEGGWLVDARTPASLGDGIGAILRAPKRIQSLAQAGACRARTFSVERMAEATYGIYRRVLSD